MKTLRILIVGGYSLVGLISFIFLVPIVYVPTSHHYECDGNDCKTVDYYSSISYYDNLAGGVYSTGGKYWLQEPEWN